MITGKKFRSNFTPAGLALVGILIGLFLVVAPCYALTLNWTDNSDNEIGFGIEQAPAAEGPFESYGSTPANVATFTIPAGSLSAGRQYCYRVYAYFEFGRSEPSNVVCSTVPTIAAPSNLVLGE